MKREAIGRKKRFEIFAHDNFTCQYCGRFAPDVVLEVEHVVPVVLGGTNDPDNLVTACYDCNHGKQTIDASRALSERNFWRDREMRFWAKAEEEIGKVELVDIVCDSPPPYSREDFNF